MNITIPFEVPSSHLTSLATLYVEIGFTFATSPFPHNPTNHYTDYGISVTYPILRRMLGYTNDQQLHH